MIYLFALFFLASIAYDVVGKRGKSNFYAAIAFVPAAIYFCSEVVK